MTNFLKEPCANSVPFPPTSMRSCLGKLFRSYYIRLRMCAATASIDRIELHASLTNWMWDSRNRFVSSWQFRCFLGLIISKSAAIAFTGAFNFLLLLLAKSSKINFFLDLFRLERDDYETFRKPSKRFCPEATNHREPSRFVNTIIAHTLLL